MQSDEILSDEDQQAQRLRGQMAALAGFGLHAFRSEDVDGLLNRAAELVSQGLGVRYAKVLELMPGDGELLIRAGVNWRPGVVGHATLGADSESPAGYALECDQPVISPDVSKETRFRIPDLLAEHGIRSMINVVIQGADRPFGVLEVDSPVCRDFHDDDIRFLENCANLLAAAIDRQRSAHELRQAASEQGVLVQELAHRVKNMLGLVQSLAMQTGGDDPAARAYRDTFVGRLQALARAETLLFEDGAQEVDFRELLPRSLEPFGGSDSRAFSLEGPSLVLPARSGRILALVLHELATNATKYGALSTDVGRVRVAWNVEEHPTNAPGRTVAPGLAENTSVIAAAGTRAIPCPNNRFDAPTEVAGEATTPLPAARWLRLRWTEEAGPAVVPPARQGFGTRLLTTLARYELGGDVQLEHAPAGLRYELYFPVART